ncbi:ribbon-helix-helix protein, CopG family [Roseovarius sp. SK2]|uniref:ribbon-helix-helix protein, CopG family n=1 Tax=Roseovarius TaxID=74030 RepID=UPI00237B4C02|nr:ribbon-helix-helix protein, CopG family [Roseovarius sp. SK2]MDD9725954.1 ribbon-helix-helix protein, CopG family [Roseovarius sp. SK2]
MSKFGRPRTDTSAVTLRLHVDMLQAIDDIRREETDVPTRPEMIRRIIADWLDQKIQDSEK